MKKIICIALAAIMLFGLFACNSSPVETQSSSPVSGDTAPENSSDASPTDPIEVTVACSYIQSTMDILYNGFPTSKFIMYLVYDRLVNFDEDYNMYPGVASSWERVDDVTWKFNINLDHVFHNGDKLTMDDVVYSILRLKDYAQMAYIGASIDNVSYEGNALTIKFISDDNTLLSSVLAEAVIVDKAYIEEKGEEEALHLHPIGTGPYMMTEFTPGTSATVEAWSDYPFWDNYPYLRPSNIDKISFIGISERASRYVAVETGQVQLAYAFSYDETKMADDNPNLGTYTKSVADLNGFILNCGSPPFDNVNVRRAIMHGLDVESFCALDGERPILKSMIFAGYSGWYVEPPLPEFDLEKAKSMLEAEGYNASNPLQFEITTFMLTEPGLELYVSNMKSIGVDVSLNYTDYGVFQEDMMAGNFDLIFDGRLNDGANPLSDLKRIDYNMRGTESFCWYYNERVQEIIDTMRVTNDETELHALNVELVDILGQDVPMIPIFQFQQRAIFDKNLSGLMIHSDGLITFRYVRYGE